MRNVSTSKASPPASDPYTRTVFHLQRYRAVPKDRLPYSAWMLHRALRWALGWDDPAGDKVEGWRRAWELVQSHRGLPRQEVPREVQLLADLMEQIDAGEVRV